MKFTFPISAFLIIGASTAATPPAHSAPGEVARPYTRNGNGITTAVPLNALVATEDTASTAETLPSGVIFLPTIDRTSPRVAISLLIGEGAAAETAADAGWRRLLIAAMAQQAPNGYEIGATDVAKQESLANAASELGGTISVTVGDDVAEISVEGDSARGADLLKLALAVLQTPRLTDENIDKARERQLDRVNAQDLQSTTKIDNAIRTQVFRDSAGDLAAYGLPDDGTAKSLAALDNDKVRALQMRFASAPLTVSAAGDVDVAALRNVLNQLPARAPMASAKPAFALPKAGAPSLRVSDAEVDGAFVIISYPLTDFDAADGPAMRVLVAALSDAKGARLPSRLSNNTLVKGAPQAETVSAQWLSRRYASELLLTAQTAPSGVEGVKNVLLDEVNKLRQKPISATELDRARAYSRGDWALDRQDLRNRAFLVGLPTALEQPADATWQTRLAQVSAADVQRVANKYLKPYAVALVMPKN